MVGLTGSGKTSVANFLAPMIGADVVSGDKVKMVLRKMGKGYEDSRFVAERYAISIVKQGRNVVVDSDFVYDDKRKNLEAEAKKIKAKVFYLRVFCDRDVMIGRLATAKYPKDSFFGGAGSNWSGPNTGAVVALREMWRRTPNHYEWLPKDGGRFILKKLPIRFMAEIETTKDWEKEIKQIAQKLRAL